MEAGGEDADFHGGSGCFDHLIVADVHGHVANTSGASYAAGTSPGFVDEVAGLHVFDSDGVGGGEVVLIPRGSGKVAIAGGAQQ